MSNPGVCCIMLANGRPAMVERAIRCFKRQTYDYRHLLIFDSGKEPLYDMAQRTFAADPTDITISYCYNEASNGLPIGTLRNKANELSLKSWELLCHWDSDDWSHHRRIEEQVALIDHTRKECVGYSDMLFWRSVQLTEKDVYGEGSDAPCDVAGDAWNWRTLNALQPIGTSLMYRRKAWERVPFLAMPNATGATSEYYHWIKQVNALAVSSKGCPLMLSCPPHEDGYAPRMIASIHGGNSQYYDPAEYVANQRGTSWERADSWDYACRVIMEGL